MFLQGALHGQRSRSGILPLEFEHHCPSAQDRPTKTGEDAIAGDRKTLDVDAVVFARDVPKPTQVVFVSAQTLGEFVTLAAVSGVSQTGGGQRTGCLCRRSIR